MFSVPNNIGGRYSVFTSVGLFPMAIMGINVDKIMEGAYSAMTEYNNPDLDENICYEYAGLRNILYGKAYVFFSKVLCYISLSIRSKSF